MVVPGRVWIVADPALPDAKMPEGVVEKGSDA
jgi:hypothetical protein